jgi:hypothetical protein
LIALIVVAGPVLLATLTGWQQRRARKHDDERQDLVAARLEAKQEQAAVRAEQAAARTREVAERLLVANADVARVARENAEVVGGKLNQIHELVNSTLTSAFEAQLVALEQLLAALQGGEPTPEGLRSAQERIADVKARLADRARQTVLADAQVTTRD